MICQICHVTTQNEKDLEKYGEELRQRRDDQLAWLADNESLIESSTSIQKLFGLNIVVTNLYLFPDDQVVQSLAGVGVSSVTTRHFISFDSIFSSLRKLAARTVLILPFCALIRFNEAYVSAFFYSVLALEPSVDVKLSTALDKIARQLREDRFFKGERRDDLKQEFDNAKNSFESVARESDTSFQGNAVLPNIRRGITFPHKAHFKVMYKYLLDLNRERNTLPYTDGQFKAAFYDLMAILILDKSILNDSDETRAKYVTEKSFKTKRVEQLLGL
jgi:hypothetical protein